MQTMTLCTLRRILHRDVVGERADVDAELGQRRARILEQAPLEGRVDPGAGDDLGAQRRRAAVHEIDLRGDLLGRQHALLDQQRADRLLQHLVGADRARHRGPSAGARAACAMIVIVVVVIVMVVVMHRACVGHSYFSGSSQCSKISTSRSSPAAPRSAARDASAQSAPCRAPARAGRAGDRRAARDCGRCRARRPPRPACRARTRACGNGRGRACRAPARHRPARSAARRPARQLVLARGDVLTTESFPSQPCARPCSCLARISAMRASISSRRQHLLLDQQIAHRPDPLLVVRRAVVFLLAVVLDGAPVRVGREGARRLLSRSRIIMASVRFSQSARSCSWRSMGPKVSPPTSCAARPPAPLRGIVFRSGALIVAVHPGSLAGHDAPMLSIALDARAPDRHRQARP